MAKLTVKSQTCIVISKVASHTLRILILIITIIITITINLEQGEHVGGSNESNRSRNDVYDICKVVATVLS